MVTKYSMYGLEFDKYLDLDALYMGNWFFTADATATPMGGGYAYYDGTAFAPPAGRMAIPFPLGPFGSGWAVAVWYYSAGDVGKLILEWGTTTIDELSIWGSGTTTSIADPSEYPGFDINWYRTNYEDEIDCYTGGAPGWFREFFRTPLVVNGTMGQMLAADSSGAAPGWFANNRFMDGGGDSSVMWWLGVRTNGKNAGSSSAQLKIGGIQVFRVNADSSYMA